MSERATTEAEVEEITERWHKGIGPDELHDALGWTKGEYKTWAETGRLPLAPEVVEEVMSAPSLNEATAVPDEAVEQYERLQAATARGDDPEPEVPDLMADLKASLDAVRRSNAPEGDDVDPELVERFFGSRDIELEQWQKDFIKKFMADSQATFDDQITPTLDPNDEPAVQEARQVAETLADQTETSSIKVVETHAAVPPMSEPPSAEAWREALEARPPVLTMWQASQLDVEEIKLPAADPSHRLPQVVDPEHLRAGDQVTLEWIGVEGEAARFTGRIMRVEVPETLATGDIDTMNISSDGRWWVYLAGTGKTFLRSPLDDALRVVHHLMFIDGKAIQTKNYKEHGR
jgi:hypothetical protein